MASLALAANSQIPGLTGRRFKMPYDAALMSQIPAARSVEQDRLTNKYRLDALKQNQDQVDADQLLKRDLGKKQEDASKTSSWIQMGNLALPAAALIGPKNIWTGVEKVGGWAKDLAKPVIDLAGQGSKPLAEAAKSFLPNAAPSALPAAENAAPLAADAAAEAEAAMAALANQTAVEGGGTLTGQLASQLAAENAAPLSGQLTSDLIAKQLAEKAAEQTALQVDAALASENAASEAAWLASQGTGSTAGTGTATGATAAGTSVAGVLAYIAAAEIARSLWGGQGIPWEEKTKQQKAMDAPLALGLTSTLLPGAMVAPDGTAGSKMQGGIANAERVGMAPIDYLFSGDYSSEGLARAEKQQRDNLATLEDNFRHPFGDDEPSGWAQVGNALLNPVNAVVEMFCFLAGTPIIMADGTIKPVEEIDLLDDCYGGGVVNAKGVTLAEDIYDYEGVGVTGSHAVYEDGVWIRVKDSQKGKYTPPAEAQKVYIINNMRHQLRVNDIIFADYGEVTDSDDMTSQERLDYLNEYCRF